MPGSTTVCPECGVVGLRINRQTGLCAKCSEKQHLAESIAFNDLLLDERLDAADEREIDELRRENASMRQRNSRLCRKYGLPNVRERQRAMGRVRDTGGECQHDEKTEADIQAGGEDRGDEEPRHDQR